LYVYDAVDSQLREKMKNVPAVVSWKYDFSVSHQKGILIVTRSDRKDYMEVWEPHVVDKKTGIGASRFFVSQQQEKKRAVRQRTHLETESCPLLGNSRQIDRKNAAVAWHVTDI
jgi:hypothetical protein